jgi:DnaJ-class molecular chaperone
VGDLRRLARVVLNMARIRERDEAIAEVTARLKNNSLSPCLNCGGQGYTDQGKSACFWCRGAGVITQQMAYAFGVADRAEGMKDEHVR